MFLRQIDPGGRARQGRTYRRYRTLSAKLTLLSSLILLLDPVSAQTRETVRLSIAEESPLGSLVGSIPTRPGFTYRFNTEEQEFSLDGETGEIRTRGRLDREVGDLGLGDTRDLIVLSSSPTYPIEVVITVTDINDNAPQFPTSVSQISFSEGSTPGTRALLDSAIDIDSGQNGRIVNYRIQSGNEDGKFKLSFSNKPDSKVSYVHLETTASLDREERSSYLLNITAADGGRPALTGSMLLTVIVLDINDNAPVFLREEYEARINETAVTGSFVTQVRAKDADTGENSRLSYLLAQSLVSDQFNIDSETGVVTTTTRLSCPGTGNTCQVTVIARDHGAPRQDVQATLKIVLIDANDHDPQILFRYFPDQTAKYATVEENAKAGNLVSAITVTDRDKGNNGKTRVKITEGNQVGHFRLDSRGDIHVVRVDSQLDRETTRLYNLTVVAEDMGNPPRTSTAFLIIHVNDINDHAPAFTEQTYKAVLTESSPIGSFVAAPLALDSDTGVNSNIYYSIVRGNDLQWFDINHVSGLITTRLQIDRETQSDLQLLVSARDGGTSPKFATATVAIKVEDENDEWPVFLHQEDGRLDLEISENTRVGSKITTVQAVDNDRGRNGSITYHLSSGVSAKYGGTFEINPSTGDIRVNSLLDRESLAKYQLIVHARDGGEPAKTSTMTINMDLVDTNDNSPVFYPLKYYIVIQSDFQQEEPLVQIRATDKDEGINAVISYELSDGDTTAFSLEENTGRIYLRQPVSQLQQDNYKLRVTARDRKGRKSTESALVEVDVESPELQYLSCTENLYQFSVPEDSSLSPPSVGRQVGRVSLERNSLVGLSFEIIDGNELDTFTIDSSSGQILTSQAVDRESEERTVLKIRAESPDTRLSAICLAEVEVTDVNDQHPVIEDTELLSVAEDAPIKEMIKIVRAVDGDKGQNSRLQYKLSDSVGGYFSIDEETGAIIVEKSLKTSQSRKFSLTVVVRDAGQPPLSSNFTYQVEVTDVNDQTPLFDLQEYDLSLPENSQVNSKVFWLKATDGDEGENGRVEYSITSGDNETFGIFPDGNLYLKLEVDREERDYYSLGITTRDNGEPRRSSTTTMTIHITDKNDNPPEFSSKKYKFYMTENEQENTFIGQIYASDRDIGRNSELTFSSEKTVSYFSVDAKTGFIVSNAEIDRERLISELGTDSITFEVVVSDNGIPKMSDTATVTVTIQDENDNSPVFSKDTYVARVSESSGPGTEVKAIFASDLDSGENGVLHYKIVGGNRNRKFSINATTGVLYLDAELDREDTASYVLLIQAEDGGSPALSAACSVIIIVTDENDNPPRLSKSGLSVTLPEDTPVGDKIFYFSAEDEDEGDNAELRYFISGGSYQKHFIMDQYTGSLVLQQPLDYERDKRFTLEVTVSDQGSPSLSDTATLRLTVTDVNDNPPKFPSTAIVRQIPEGLPLNSAVLTMEAHDADSGDNGKVEFSLAGYEAGSAEKFRIDPKTGVISTVGDLDREEVDTFRFTVVATDQALPASSRLSAEKVITIIVEDINDNSPEFVSVPTGVLSPSTQAGDVIMTVQATDRDSNSNGQVTYKLQRDSYIFSIDHYSGEISLKNRAADLEPLYEFEVVASDEAVQSERKSSSTTVTILVLSSQQPGSEFSKPSYSASISESDPAGSFIATVEVLEPAGQKFYITSVRSEAGRSSNLFSLDPRTGDIRTVRQVDRESHGAEFIITVLAVQREGETTKTSSCEVSLTVEDVNDSPPVFQDISSIRFSEDTNPGVPFSRVRAFDSDLNNVIKYSIVGGDKETFSIDEVTGDISLLHTVDREQRETYRLTVEATDSLHTSQASLILVVQDANDNIPTFAAPSFSFDVYESAGKGVQVGKITATDEDRGDNALITYDLISDWGNEVFSLNPTTGIFTLTSELDFEAEEHYRFVVSGSDHGQPRLSSTVTVYINVKDVNDNSPTFTQAVYRAEVAEDAAPGSSILQVEATDLDSENNGDIEYSIIGEAEEYFGIYSNGTLYSRRLLDREYKESFSFILKATDGGQQGGRHSTTASVVLTLSDVNDQPPEFTSPAEGFILENQPANTVVMAVSTRDLDEGENADVEYFLSKSDSDNFEIGRLDGIIRTRVGLDREERAEYSVVVTARDHGSPPLSNNMEITITVLDQNDNTPRFEPRIYSRTVLENATLGQNILHTKAFDSDLGLNGEIRYTIVSGDRTADFSIGEFSGVIRVDKKLDFERKTAYQLTIQAEDSGSPVRYDTASVSIYIEDVNDSPPIFLHTPYLAFLVENGDELPRYVTSVTAVDKDNPPHNKMEYTMKKTFNGAFSVNGSTGDIFLHSALDRETFSQYELEVVAVDIGNPRLSSTGTLSVVVEDENDNPPQFSQSQYSARLDENSEPNTVVTTITASDPDLGQNSLLTYSLKGEDAAKFLIDSVTGEVRTRWSLDREEQEEFLLVVTAEDQGEDVRLSGSCLLTVRLDDQNDNQPELINNPGTLNIPDNAGPGHFLYKFDVRDTDSGANSELQFFLRGDAGRFSLDQNTGVLTARSNVGNVGESHSLEVEVSDRGDPPLSTRETVRLLVSSPAGFPRFDSTVNQLSVREGELARDLPSVEANSVSGREVKYRIVAGDLGGHFSIHSDSGKLSNVKTLDREEMESFNFYIGASEIGSDGQMSFLKMNVLVEDINDNPPVFSMDHYEAEVEEEQFPGLKVITVLASDADIGDNAKLQYRWRGTDRVPGFDIDPTSGDITTNVKLDREEQEKYELYVEAYDNGEKALSGAAVIKVTVKDINDNPPKFTRILSINITENSPIGTKVVTVETTDKDTGENAEVSFELTENPGEKFEIDSVTGDITVTGSLDREEQDEYLLKVVATDGAWRAETSVGINIQDENDNSPVFDQEEYVMIFPPTKSAVSLVGRVNARDSDGHGDNSHLKYRLRESSEYFSIDSSSGEIISKQRLDYIKTTRSESLENVYLMSVIVSDHGQPPLSDECLVKILVTDENKHAPQFSSPEYTKAITASARVGMELVQVEAEDKLDTGLNAMVEFSLEPSEYSGYFTIDPRTGSVRLARALSVAAGEFVLTVLAADLGSPPLTSSATLTLMLSGENRFSPQFSDLSTQVIIPENEPSGSLVIKLTAEDRDQGINGMVRYHIVDGNQEEHFRIDERSGEISINKALDYDMEHEYNLTIVAEDLAFQSKRAESVLKIILTDVNDNGPFFERSHYDAYLQENSPPGSKVITMSAIDFDSPRYSGIEYSIEEESLQRYFKIDKTSGEIQSRVSFDYEKSSEYSLHVTASNPGSAEANKTLVNVHITGTNEFFPHFQQPVFQFVVSESAVPGTAVGQVQATDLDQGRDGEVFYFLMGRNTQQGFRINKRTGVISVHRALDRESQSRFVLTVLAKNQGSIVGNDTDEAQVIIQVQDGNDPPVFSQSEYRARVLENIQPGTSVLTVRAVDKDVRPRNSQFSFSIISGNEEEKFEMDPSSGSIRTVAALDRERQETHLLSVAAVDNGTPAQTGTASVVITVGDVNDSPPWLEPASRELSVVENSPPNTLVARLLPTDPDLPPHTGPFTFSLSGGRDRELFSIDRSSGQLRSLVSLDREAVPASLEVEVTIRDGGNPPQQASYPLSVIVEDENDNPSSPRTISLSVQTLRGDFPGGLLAPVLPRDPDTSGRYSCEIQQGPRNIFNMMDNCELHSGRLNNVRGYNLTVTGSDGRHDSVTSRVQVTFDKFSESAVDQTVILRLVRSEPEVVGEVVAQLSDTVQLLSLSLGQNNTDLFLAVKSGEKYLSRTKALQTLQARLAGQLPATADLGYTVCDRDNPCQNNGLCSSRMEVRQETVIAEIGDLILNSPKLAEEVSCQCPENFEGSWCELKSNPCSNPAPCQAGGECVQEGYSFKCICPPHRTGQTCQLEKSNSCDRNPCQNGGTCRQSNFGDSFCLCRPGFQGDHCEVTLDPCQPNPCQNGGECISKKPNYQCKCPDNFYGTNCEKSTFGFSRLSFMTFPTLDPNTNDISITFSTTKANSLLVYNYGESSGGRSDFLAVQLVEGKATFSFGGARTAITEISVNKYIADGRWFKVTATRNNRVASLSVEDCTESGEYCKLCQAGDESCFTKDIGDTGTLNFNNNPVYFGGLETVQPLLTRPGQVGAGDFVGCVKSLSVAGQQMDLSSSPLSSRGILSSCPVRGRLCEEHHCGGGGLCTELDSAPLCVCPGGVTAQDCTVALQPVALTQNSTVHFQISETFQRSQFFSGSANEVSFTFRTEHDDGQIFSSGNSADHTHVYVASQQLVYETKKSGYPRINITSELIVSDGEWHVLIIKQTDQILQLYLDDVKLDDDLETESTHNFLDPYLSEISFGGRQNSLSEGFHGCLVNFTINNEVQSFHGGSRLLHNVSYTGEVQDQCLPSFLSSSVGSDPVNVGVIIVLVFFIILIFAILGSFFLFRMKKKKYEKMQNRSATDSVAGPGLQGRQVSRHKKLPSSPHQPDVIEREVVAGSPVDYNDYSASMVMQEPDGPEHYDLENASSIAPSDIDVIYHYKGYREGGRGERWGRGGQDKMVASSPIRLQSLGGNKMQSTPLARLSPTSEMSHQTPRILTLQDISGKPIQSALLQTQQRHSGRMSQLSDSSASDLNSSSRQRRQHRVKKKKSGLSSAEDVSRMQNRNSIDSSGRKSKTKFNDLLETNTEMLQEDNSSSDSPSENDSFTCSEYDCETPYEPGSKQMENSGNASGMVFRKLNTTPGQGSLTTLNISDEELTGFASPSGPTSWESLLNWSPNFNSFVGVFKDIAELPDIDSDVRPNPLGDREEEEEYI